MALGRQQGELRAFTTPADEAPEAVPAQAEPIARRPDGTVAGPEAAKALGRKGGRARARRLADAAAWGARLGLGRHLSELPPNVYFEPFAKEAEEWLQAASADLAATAGGGKLSPSVTSMLRSAAWARAYSAYLYDCASRSVWAFDRDEKAKPPVRPNVELVSVASRLADSSRQNTIAAFEIASREAAARPAEGLAAIQARILGGGS